MNRTHKLLGAAAVVFLLAFGNACSDTTAPTYEYEPLEQQVTDDQEEFQPKRKKEFES